MVAFSNDSPSILKSGDISADEVIGAIEHEAGFLPQIELAYEAPIKAVWVTLRPEPKPVFTYDLLRSLNAVHHAVWTLWGSQESYANSPVRFLAFRGRGPVLTLGGDLDFYLDCLAKGDRAALSEYARASAEGVCWNASSARGAAITLSTVQGKAYGGGIDAPCSCNVVVAEQQASFCYPEVKFNHFPITAVSVLSRRAGARNANKILSSGKEYSVDEFEAMGALDAVAPTGEGENWLRRYAADTLPMHSARLSLFVAFHRNAGKLEEELAPLAKMWTDSMMRLNPMQISRLQRLAQGQERMLQYAFASSAPNTVSGSPTAVSSAEH
jgi:DSF synthase